MIFHHTPVLLHQVIQSLSLQKGHWYIDATLGGGGYTLELLKNGVKVLAIDTDRDAICAVQEKLAKLMPDKQEGVDYYIVHENFRHVGHIIAEKKLKIQGIVADLGISSYQLDTPERGFSYRFEEAELDMRLSQDNDVKAKDIINHYSEEDLYEIIANYGEEERSRAIAAAIVSARKVNVIHTTGDLLAIIQQVIPGNVYETASRVFQAIRMEVNDELSALKQLLQESESILSSGGILAIVTFHSLEDRVVKLSMKKSCWSVLNKQPIVPDQQEIIKNSRARSAKLRVAIRNLKN